MASCSRITQNYIDDSLIAHKKKAASVWRAVVSDMEDDAEKEQYHIKNHNCYTVSCENIRTNKELLDEEAIKNINKRDFNFLGMRISFNKYDDSFWYYIKGLFRSSSDSIASCS